MKANKIITLMLCLVAGLGFTSCLDDDDNNDSNFRKMTNEEFDRNFGLLKGGHTGTAYVYYTSNTTPSDTLKNVRWEVSVADTSLVIYDVPTKLLTKNATKDDGEVQKAIASTPKVTIKSKLYLSFYRSKAAYQVFPYLPFIGNAAKPFYITLDSGNYYYNDIVAGQKMSFPLVVGNVVSASGSALTTGGNYAIVFKEN